MDKIGHKYYFNVLFLIIFSSLGVLGFTSQIAFILFGVINGISNWGIEGVLIFGFAGFGLFDSICIFLILFGGLNYWRIDKDGIANGGVFRETKVYFESADSYKIDRGYIPSTGGSGIQTTECFHLIKGRKDVIVPLYFLSEDEIDWLESQVIKTM